jgi:ubiquitin-conjugating enzyme E2 J2
VCGIEAAPLEKNILEWHYVITGAKGTPYEGDVSIPIITPLHPSFQSPYTPEQQLHINSSVMSHAITDACFKLVGGTYHGKLVFPSEYPYKPPSIMMLTPNGRFALNQRLCLSMSDFHPETWFVRQIDTIMHSTLTQG